MSVVVVSWALQRNPRPEESWSPDKIKSGIYAGLSPQKISSMSGKTGMAKLKNAGAAMIDWAHANADRLLSLPLRLRSRIRGTSDTFIIRLELTGKCNVSLRTYDEQGKEVELPESPMRVALKTYADVGRVVNRELDYAVMGYTTDDLSDLAETKGAKKKETGSQPSVTPAARRERAKPTYANDGSVTAEGMVAFLHKKGVRVGSTVTADGMIPSDGKTQSIPDRDSGKIISFADGAVTVAFSNAGMATWTAETYPSEQLVVTQLAGDDKEEIIFDADMLKEGALTLQKIWKARSLQANFMRALGAISDEARSPKGGHYVGSEELLQFITVHLKPSIKVVCNKDVQHGADGDFYLIPMTTAVSLIGVDERGWCKTNETCENPNANDNGTVCVIMKEPPKQTQTICEPFWYVEKVNDERFANMELKDVVVSLMAVVEVPGKRASAQQNGTKIRVPCMFTKRDIKKGETLTCHYTETGRAPIKRARVD